MLDTNKIRSFTKIGWQEKSILLFLEKKALRLQCCLQNAYVSKHAGFLIECSQALTCLASFLRARTGDQKLSYNLLGPHEWDHIQLL